MKFQINISGKNIILTQHQLEILLTAVQDAEQLGEKHVGNGQGSQGYQKAYVPIVEVKHSHDWLNTLIVSDDYLDAIKLTMKVSADAS
jgi:hypothetical protein